MGAWGAIIMSFFGSVFCAMTLAIHFHWPGASLALPFLAFAAIAIAAALVIRRPGDGIRPSPRADRAIMWSSIGEGVGLFLAANLVINLGHRDLLLPAMALVVGLHFLPIAFAAPFRPFYALGLALLAASAFGFVAGPPLGGEVAGLAAAAALFVAAAIAVVRDMRAKSRSLRERPDGVRVSAGA
jgi:membrane protein implicated in regulation of membrane protease activity